MEEVLTSGRMLVEILDSLIGWGGFLTLVWMFRGFAIEAMSMAFAREIPHMSEDAQRRIIRWLTDARLTAKELYAEMKEREAADEDSR